jgi:hypothetical protein
MTLLPQLSTSKQSAYTYTGSAITAAAQQVIDAAKAKSDAGSVSTSSGVSISIDAIRAAAEKADNGKDFATLSQEIRTTLDSQYAAARAAGANPAPDLNAMSGRALSAIALNKTGAFSHSEMLAARTELRQRALDELTTALKSGNALDALTAYNEQLMTDYDGMSQEERDARGWTADVRASAEKFVTAVKGNDGTPSLFDMLNSDG